MTNSDFIDTIFTISMKIIALKTIMEFHLYAFRLYDSFIFKFISSANFLN